jgi:hypothetical protein
MQCLSEKQFPRFQYSLRQGGLGWHFLPQG